MSRLVGAAALALLLFASLLMTAPARLLGLVVPADQVVLRGLSGTVWNGSATGVMLRLPQGYFQLGAVQWSLHPLSLLTLSPHLSVRSVWGDQRFSGEVILRGSQDLELLDLEAQLAAGSLARFAPVAVAGHFSLQAELLEIRGGMPYSAKGRLVWQNAGWKSPRGLVPLGTYALDFEQPEGGPVQGEILSLSGPLEATGTLALEQRHYEVDVQLRSDTDLDAQVQQMLSLIATPQASGFNLVLAGDL
ncbi:MAG: type II secretion system protein N [Halioglobus sp.]|nr:type II secretion system protein N [Halioglobus sp.]